MPTTAPSCRWRAGPALHDRSPCTSPKVHAPHGVTEETCRACYCRDHPAVEQPEPIPPCMHRGAATGETRVCQSCAGRVEVKLFACALHGACSLIRAVDDAACCVRCPDRRAAPEPDVERLAADLEGPARP